MVSNHSVRGGGGNLLGDLSECSTNFFKHCLSDAISSLFFQANKIAQVKDIYQVYLIGIFA